MTPFWKEINYGTLNILKGEIVDPSQVIRDETYSDFVIRNIRQIHQKVELNLSNE